MSRSTVIPGDAILTMTLPGGGETTILWSDLVSDLLSEAVAGSRLVLPQTDEAATPTIAFGIGTSGWYERVNGDIRLSLVGVNRWTYVGNAFRGAVTGSPALTNVNATATVPNISPDQADIASGLGSPGAGQVSLIGDNVEGLRLTSDGTNVIQTVEANVGLTADVGSGIGDGLILSSYNVYSTVGSAGDAATLPEIFPVNTLVYVKNDAAVNSMDVFPFLGTDLGAGGDTALAVAAGDFVVFIATVADATWTQLMAGSA